MTEVGDSICQSCRCIISRPFQARMLNDDGETKGVVNLYAALGDSEDGRKLLEIIRQLVQWFQDLKPVYQPCYKYSMGGEACLAVKGKIQLKPDGDLSKCRYFGKPGSECKGSADSIGANITLWFIKEDAHHSPKVRVTPRGNLHLDDTRLEDGTFQFSWMEKWSQEGSAGVAMVEGIRQTLESHLHKDAPLPWFKGVFYKIVRNEAIYQQGHRKFRTDHNLPKVLDGKILFSRKKSGE